MIPEDADTEIRILRKKLTEKEDQLELVQKALWETDTKIHNVMRRLLTANDVNKGSMAFVPMRANILEQMNDLRRQVLGFFSNVGVTPDASDGNGNEIRPIH